MDTGSPQPPLVRSIARLDEAVDISFNHLRGNRRADWVAYAASEAADYSVAWHAISIAMAVLSPRRRPHSVRLATMLAIESIVVNGGIKRLTNRERPPLRPDAPFEVRRPNTKSFPSGHASSAALTAVLLTDAVPRLRPVWFALAATVSASRIHNRMHHASDVAAGGLLGTLFGMAAKRFWPLA